MIKVAELGVKAQSKKEVYRLMSTSMNIYLPPLNETNMTYLKELLNG
jgi:hypothetical protein